MTTTANPAAGDGLSEKISTEPGAAFAPEDESARITRVVRDLDAALFEWGEWGELVFALAHVEHLEPWLVSALRATASGIEAATEHARLKLDDLRPWVES